MDPVSPAGPVDGMSLPPAVEAAWGLRERPHRGPKPGLSLLRIVEAGVQIAESEGLAAHAGSVMLRCEPDQRTPT